MTQLKTLKDIAFIYSKVFVINDFKSQKEKFFNEGELRQEAIKWIFALMDKMTKEKRKLAIHEYIGMIQVLKEFCNIEESELA